MANRDRKHPKKRGFSGRSSRACDAPSLVSLAVARTGREIDMAMLQILDQEAFGDLWRMQLEAMSRLLSGGGSISDPVNAVSGHEQEDGTLTLYSNVNGSSSTVAKGKWRVLTPEEMRQVEKELAQRAARNSDAGEPTLHDLVMKMSSLVRQSADHEMRDRKAFEEAMTKASQCIVVLDRSSVSMNLLHAFLGSQLPTLRDKADEWLQTDQPYLVISHGLDPVARWMVGVPSRADLLAGALEDIADAVDDLGSCALVSGAIRDPKLAHELDVLWHTLGGANTTQKEFTQPRRKSRSDARATINDSTLIIDHSEPGITALVDSLARIGSDAAHIERTVSQWRESTATYLVYGPQGVLTVNHADHLVHVIEGNVLASLCAGTTAMCVLREVSERRLEEVKGAISKATESAFILHAARKRGLKALEWAKRSFEGLSLEVLDSPDCAICIAKLDPGVVRSGITGGLIALLEAMVEDSVALFASRSSLVLMTPDYDDDPRGLYDVPEARSFARDVAARCPWWLHAFYMNQAELSPVAWWVMSLTERTNDTRDDGMRSHAAERYLKVIQESEAEVSALFAKACKEQRLSALVARWMIEDTHFQAQQLLEWMQACEAA